MMNFSEKIFIASTIYLLFCVCLFRAQKLEGKVYPNQGICNSKDIRNSPRQLESLRNCTIIVGYLQVVLMEDLPDHAFDGYSFPELREVTQFVIFYRVEGLASLSQLFPNLSLIRGRELIVNYALIIYELPQLKEIGLRSLTIIQRGSVRVEKNPHLCFTETVSWEKITGRKTGHYFGGNGQSMCPGPESCRGCDDGCWNAMNCQRSIASMKCHPECLGGCTSIGSLCYRCKHLIDDNMCVETCPPHKYEYAPAFQCITEELCRKMYHREGWIWDGKCVRRCPTGYELKIKNGKKTCEYCDKCITYCYGINVNSLSDAQQSSGCHIVNGSVEIRLDGEHSIDTMKEMEDHLGSIEEIRGYLKVYRSVTLTSLDFFKNLTVIHGDELVFDRYSLVVYEMNNLQSTWDWSTKKNLTLVNGTVFFHNNAKLCLSEVNDLVKMTNMNNASLTTLDVSNESNGYKIICQKMALVTESQVLGKTNATISWERFKPSNANQSILGYLLFYMEEPDNDVTPDFGRDSCYDHEWISVFINEPKEPLPNLLTYNLTDLKPSTKYAFYVETYNSIKGQYVTGVTGKHGQSVVKFFTTETDIPSMPFDVRTTNVTENTITINWSDDPEYKGTITRYVIEMYIQLDDLKFLDTRNYCYSPLDLSQIVEKKEEPVEKDTGKEDGCHCGEIPDKAYWDKFVANQAVSSYEIYSKTGSSMLCKTDMKPSEEVFDILNEKRCGLVDYSNKKRFDVEVNETESHERQVRRADFKVPKDFVEEPTPRPFLRNITKNNKYHFFSAVFEAQRKNYTLFNLLHYTKYIIFVSACMGNQDSDCGPISMTAQRTLKNETADDVVDISSIVLKYSAAVLYWEEPKNPNGAIVSFTIEYIRLDVSNFKPIQECVTRLDHEKNGGSYTLNHLHHGNYSVRVKATSLGGNGEFTKPHYFYVPISDLVFNVGLFLGIGVGIASGIGVTMYFYHRKRYPCRSDERELMRSDYFEERSSRTGLEDGEETELIELT